MKELYIFHGAGEWAPTAKPFEGQPGHTVLRRISS